MLTLDIAHHNVGGLPARMMNGVSDSLEFLYMWHPPNLNNHSKVSS